MPIGRLYTEIGKNIDRMNASLRQAVTTAQAVGPEFAKINSAGLSLISRFQDVLNPTLKFKEQLELLGAAGFKQIDIWKQMGDQLLKAAEAARANGQPVDALVQKLIDANKATQGAGFSFENLGKSIQEFARNPMQAAKSAVTGMLEKLGPLGVAFGAVATAAVAAGVGLFKFVSAAADNLERLENLSAITGLAVADLQAMEQITKEAGLAGMDLGSIIGKLNQDMFDFKSNEMTEAMELFGISIEDVKNKNMDAIDVLDEMRTALLGIEDPAKRAQLANQALGGRLRELIPLLTNSEKGLRESMEEVKAFGVATDEVTNQRLREFDNMLDLVSRGLKAAKTAAEEAVAGFFDPNFWKHLLETSSYTQARLLADMDLIIKSQKEMTTVTEEQRLKGEMLLQQYDRMIRARGDDKKAVEAQKKAYELVTDQMRLEQEYQKKYIDDINDQLIRALDAEIAKHLEVGKSIAVIRAEFEKLDVSLDKLKTNDPLKDLLPKPSDLKDIEEKIEVLVGMPAKLAGETSRQISTIFTDLSRELADAILNWDISSVGDAFKSFGKAMLRILIEEIISPLEKYMAKAIRGIIDWAKGIFTGGSTGQAGFPGGGIGLGVTALGTGIAAGPKIFPGPDWAGYAAGGAIGAIGAVTAIGAIGGAAGGIGAGAGAWGALSGFMTNPFTVIPAITAIALPFVINAIQGKNAWQAGSPEAMRDFKVTLPQDTFKQFATSLGLSEPQTYPIRKELLSSPLALTQLLAPLAEANGQMDAFLKSLEAVSTSWGTFNLRSAFEAGQASGDFAELNKVWMETIGTSSALARIMPDFASQLAAIADAIEPIKTATDLLIESLTGLRDTILGSVTPLQTMYDIFLTTGKVTDEFAAKILELGGNLEDFQRLASQNIELAGLQQTMGFLDSLRSSLQNLAPLLDPINQLLSGRMGPEAIAALTSAGLDPSRFQDLTGAIQMQSGWDKAIGQFQQSGNLSAYLKQALAQFGGTAGSTALERYAQGFNTVTSSLLEATKAAMDQAYQTAVKDALDYLGTVQQETADKMLTLIDAINATKIDIVDSLNIMIARLTEIAANTAPIVEGGGEDIVPDEGDNRGDGFERRPDEFEMIPHAASGGYVGKTGLAVIHQGETVVPANQGSITVNINLNGPIYADDIENKVAAAWDAVWRRSGFQDLRYAIKTGRV